MAAEFLSALESRKRFYGSEQLHELLEDAARNNLARLRELLERRGYSSEEFAKR